MTRSKANFITNLFNFLSEVKAELDKVVWPTRQQTIRLTLIVIGVSLAVGFYIGGIDWIFTKATEIILNR